MVGGSGGGTRSAIYPSAHLTRQRPTNLLARGGVEGEIQCSPFYLFFHPTMHRQQGGHRSRTRGTAINHMTGTFIVGGG